MRCGLASLVSILEINGLLSVLHLGKCLFKYTGPKVCAKCVGHLENPPVFPYSLKSTASCHLSTDPIGPGPLMSCATSPYCTVSAVALTNVT